MNLRRDAAGQDQDTADDLRSRPGFGGTVERRLRVGAALSFLVLAGLTLLIGLLFFHPPRPAADALRYIDYAASLHVHGVFGRSNRRARRRAGRR